MTHEGDSLKQNIFMVLDGGAHSARTPPAQPLANHADIFCGSCDNRIWQVPF